mgnify:CR=1 FL=1
MSNKNKKLNLNKEVLYDLYVNKKLTSKEVANILGCTSKSIRNYLKAYNIPIRSNGEAVKLDRSKWSLEKENNRSIAYMNTWKNMPDELKQQIIKSRTKNINSPEAIQKSKNTKLLNGTNKISKAELSFKNKLEINVEAFITNKIDLIRSIFIFIELGLVIATLLVLVLFFFYLIFKENDFGKQQSIKFN